MGFYDPIVYPKMSIFIMKYVCHAKFYKNENLKTFSDLKADSTYNKCIKCTLLFLKDKNALQTSSVMKI